MENTSPNDYTVKPKEVAEAMNVSTRTAQRLCEQGGLPAVKVGGQWRIRADWQEHLDAPFHRN
jgi:excisionase family DNA binding protein